MKIYCKGLLGVGFAVTALMLTLTCCTTVDDNLGSEITPPDQQLTIKFGRLQRGIETYNTVTDSVITSGMKWLYIGSTDDGDFGRTNITAVSHFFPLYRSDTVDYSATRGQKADSMWILSNLKFAAGDTLAHNRFDLYRVIDDIYADSTYYSGFPYRDHIASKPMFSFDLSGNSNGSDYDTLRLEINDRMLAEEFMNELLSLDTLYYTDSTKFIGKFKGLCMTPSPSTATNDAIYKLGLGYDDSDNYYTMLVLYGHDYLTSTPDKVEDIIVRSYVITDDADYTIGAAISCFEHDYAGTPIEGNYVKEYASDWGTAQKTTYVQGYLGVNSSIEFTDEFLTDLKALQPEGKHIFINQALMKIDVPGVTDAKLDAAPERLGTYFNFASVKAIPDYSYAYESQYSQTLNYDGYLNRTHGSYTMDIAVYLQKLLQGDYTAPYRITLGMGAYDYLAEGQTALLGTGSAVPVTIEVTYTVIGK